MTTKIYGASDDLLEFEGDIEDEFYVNCDKPFYIGLSDGTLLKMEYDDNGIWRIHLVRKGSNRFEKKEGDFQKDTNDIFSVHGEISWVLVGSEKIVNKKKD